MQIIVYSLCMPTLTIDSEKIYSLEDFYDQVTLALPSGFEYFGRNLDALEELLSEKIWDRIVIHKKNLLKDRLRKEGEEPWESVYYQLLEILMDDEHVDLVLEGE